MTCRRVGQVKGARWENRADVFAAENRCLLQAPGAADVIANAQKTSLSWVVPITREVHMLHDPFYAGYHLSHHAVGTALWVVLNARRRQNDVKSKDHGTVGVRYSVQRTQL